MKKQTFITLSILLCILIGCNSKRKIKNETSLQKAINYADEHGGGIVGFTKQQDSIWVSINDSIVFKIKNDHKEIGQTDSNTFINSRGKQYNNTGSGNQTINN